MDQYSGSDFQQMYNDLLQQVKDANTAKKKLLTKIATDLQRLMKIICEPDPPGCSGPNRPPGSFEDLCLSVQAANARKQALLTTIYSEIQSLLQRICEPDPPGCGS